MSMYINVKTELNKIIKVDTDNYDEAMSVARENFSELDITSDWIDKRDVKFEENKTIVPMAELLAEVSSKSLNFNEDELMTLVYAFSNDDDTAKYVFEETMKILKEKYHFDIEKINI